MQTNRMVSNIFSDLQFSRRVSLAPGARSVPFLQRAAAAGLDCATGRMGFNITVNSALRTLPQQVILYKWYQQRKCGIPLAASPGNSNHESGLAVDVQNANAWQNAMTACGYHRFGPADPVHYDFRGAGAVDIKRTSVKAFQILWNQHNSDKLAEDGLYGPRTESAILRVRDLMQLSGIKGAANNFVFSLPQSPARGW
jgi:hypothetical protein